MYAFEARFPIDHVLTLVANIRSGEVADADNLILIGAISGEVGALLQSGFTPTFGAPELKLPETIEECCDDLEELRPAFAAINDIKPKAFDPTIWIPLAFKLIEMILARRRQG